ncbi:MAG: sigma-70 family RNA polymerase sigma factor [Gemmataceae bacterium]
MAGTFDPQTSPTLLGRLRHSPTDEAAWEEFLRRYGPRIHGWCRGWGLQEADSEDVAQMVLLRLAARMREFEYDPTRSFRAWLKTICHHAWCDLIAARKNLVGSGDSQMLALLESVNARDDLVGRVEEAYDLELLEKAFERVRLRVQTTTWEAYRLTALEGLSGAEAATRLKMKVVSIFKAKSNVQKMLQEELRTLEGPASP